MKKMLLLSLSAAPVAADMYCDMNNSTGGTNHARKPT